MPSLIILFITATGLGIAYCGAPGAVNTELFDRLTLAAAQAIAPAR